MAACALLASISLTMNGKNSYIFLADGVEEVEAVATIDALRRAGMEVTTVAVADSPVVIINSTVDNFWPNISR